MLLRRYHLIAVPFSAPAPPLPRRSSSWPRCPFPSRLPFSRHTATSFLSLTSGSCQASSDSELIQEFPSKQVNDFIILISIFCFRFFFFFLLSQRNEYSVLLLLRLCSNCFSWMGRLLFWLKPNLFVYHWKLQVFCILQELKSLFKAT